MCKVVADSRWFFLVLAFVFVVVVSSLLSSSRSPQPALTHRLTAARHSSGQVGLLFSLRT